MGHIIRKISTEYKVLVSSAGELKSKEMIEVSSTSTLTLLSVGTTGSKLSRPALPKRHSSLIYRYPQESHSMRQQNQQEQAQKQEMQQIQSQLKQAQQQLIKELKS